MRLALEYGIEPKNMALGVLASVAILLEKSQGYNLPSDLRFGDWCEELITVLQGELRICTPVLSAAEGTNIPAKDRRTCLMQDPVYLAEVAHRSMGYEQSPVLRA